MNMTHPTLAALFTGYSRKFEEGKQATPSDWKKIATLVPSSSRSTTYGWLGQFPHFREWIGERVLKDMAAHGYSIENRKFESSISVRREDIEDDNVGVYGPLFEEMGRAAVSHRDELVFDLLKKGASTRCYDGQNFFDKDHPVYASTDGTGAATSVSNYDAGDGSNPTWYLMDVSRALKPMIFQTRREYVLKAMTEGQDEAVFMRDEYRYGVDARVNAGFGFWQFAYASGQPLTAESYAAARAAMQGIKADGGRPIGVRPNLLVVPSSLESQARKLLTKDENGGNEWAGTAQLLCTPWID